MKETAKKNFVESHAQFQPEMNFTIGVGLLLPLLKRTFRGEWPSGLRRCSKNRKVPGSNPTRRSAGPRDPTSLRGSR